MDGVVANALGVCRRFGCRKAERPAIGGGGAPGFADRRDDGVGLTPEGVHEVHGGYPVALRTKFMSNKNYEELGRFHALWL